MLAAFRGGDMAGKRLLSGKHGVNSYVSAAFSLSVRAASAFLPLHIGRE
jgi:hypothetical protein